LAEREPLKVKERAIRVQIKDAQDRKYLEIMGPKLGALKEKNASGADNLATINQIQYLQEKYKQG
jgi:hypothetical protein